MPHTTAFYDWKSRVDTLLGALNRTTNPLWPNTASA